MKRIALSAISIVFASGALVSGASGAFFSDTEVSQNNTFTAGAIDLKIDNTSYYNSIANPGTSWSETDLTNHKFFDFADLKPNDYGEDTISVHVDTNDAFICADVTLTSNEENGINEPETADGDVTAGPNEGELAQLVNFIWWADDGDNVLEDFESVISQGPIGALTLGVPYQFALADSDQNIWTNAPGPVAANTTYYIGKAWCFGSITAEPLPQDDYLLGPAGDNNADQEFTPEDGGIGCDGTLLNNASQTDSLTADVSFEAVQARHNDTFQCEEPAAPTGTLTLLKSVINDDQGSAVDTDWTLSAAGNTPISGVEGNGAVTNAAVVPGSYDLSETGPAGYTASAWVCVGGTQNDGDTVTIAAGENVTCTITNDDNDPLACTPAVRYADSVVLGDQGKRKDGSNILVDRTNPATALGAPQTTGTPSDPVVTPNSFYALGFGVNTAATRSLTLEFTNNIIVDGAGADIRVYEVTGGVYPDEHVRVEVSQNGSTWFTAAADVTRDANVDINGTGLGWAKYIRLTDINVTGPFPNDADGYDVDAVEALNCGVQI